MSIPQTTLDMSFDQWRVNTNTDATNLGDIATVYDPGTGKPGNVVAALNDLQTRKLDNTGGTISGALSVNDLTVVTSFAFNGNSVRMLSTSLSNTNVNQTLFSLGAKTTVRAAEITIRAQSSTDFQVSKLIMLHNGTDVQLSEISILAMNTLVATFTATIDGSNNIIIQATPQVANTSYEVLIFPLK